MCVHLRCNITAGLIKVHLELFLYGLFGFRHLFVNSSDCLIPSTGVGYDVQRKLATLTFSITHVS